MAFSNPARGVPIREGIMPPTIISGAPTIRERNNPIRMKINANGLPHIFDVAIISNRLILGRLDLPLTLPDKILSIH